MKTAVFSEQAFIERLQAGERAAFAELYDRYGKNLYAVIFEIVKSEPEEVLLTLAWLSADLVEDQHAGDAFIESFFILEGACECDFDGRIVRFSAGDYFEIPADTRHVIKNISEGLPYVKGLVQRRKAA